jgi:hypothetical protein
VRVTSGRAIFPSITKDDFVLLLMTVLLLCRRREGDGEEQRRYAQRLTLPPNAPRTIV